MMLKRGGNNEMFMMENRRPYLLYNGSSIFNEFILFNLLTFTEKFADTLYLKQVIL